MAADDQSSPGDPLDSLQAAAIQAIGAMRALLDAAESALQDPDARTQLTAAVGKVAQGVVGSLAPFVPPRATNSKPDDDPPLEHIDVG
jgi:hypothetical protein